MHGYFGLHQHIICTHPDQDINYSAIHLHFQGLLSGIFPLLTSKTHQMANSSVYIWVGSEILPHNCSMQCYTYYRHYIMYTNNVNSMAWPSCISCRMWVLCHDRTCISCRVCVPIGFHTSSTAPSSSSGVVLIKWPSLACVVLIFDMVH